MTTTMQHLSDADIDEIMKHQPEFVNHPMYEGGMFFADTLFQLKNDDNPVATRCLAAHGYTSVSWRHKPVPFPMLIDEPDEWGPFGIRYGKDASDFQAPS